MAQQARALSTLSEDPSSVPSTHQVTHNHLYLRDWMSLPPRAPALLCTKSINIIKDKKNENKTIGAAVYTWPVKWVQAHPGVSLVADLQAGLVYLVSPRPVRDCPQTGQVDSA